MTYKEQQTVKVLIDNNLVHGTILESGTLTDSVLWWVKVGTEVNLYDEAQLDEWNFNGFCTCKSDSLGYYTHMYFCPKFF